jgi:Bacteriophage head to tail connecting protein
MATMISKMEARRKAAQIERDQFNHLIEEAYQYAIPYRRGVQKTGTGEKRVNQVYDPTAITSAFRRSGKLAQDLAPSGQDFVVLKPGRVTVLKANQSAEGKSSLEKFRKELSFISSIVMAMFSTGDWDQALQEMCLDLQAGTGAMLIVPDNRSRMARFISVPIDEIILSSGPYNDINGIFWKRKWTYRAILEEFPKGEFSLKFKEAAGKSPEAEIELYQDTVWQPDETMPRGGCWLRVVWCKENSEGDMGSCKAIEETKTKTCPWLTPRYFRVPGETYGRGPIMMVIPAIKSLNVAMKINLQAAAIAMLGIFTAVDDGVFSPDNAPLTPGSFIKVARNGGNLGPSVQRMADPRIDLSQIVLNEMRTMVQAGMGDRQLPPDSAAVKSPTEIMERVKRLAEDNVGANGRLVKEIIVPAVERVLEIAYGFQLISNEIQIDRLLTDVEVSSPLVLSREAERIQRLMHYVEMAMQLDPQNQGKRYVKLDNVMPQVASAFAVDPDDIPNEDERKKIDDDNAALQTAAMAAQMGGAPAAPAMAMAA